MLAHQSNFYIHQLNAPIQRHHTSCRWSLDYWWSTVSITNWVWAHQCWCQDAEGHLQL